MFLLNVAILIGVVGVGLVHEANMAYQFDPAKTAESSHLLTVAMALAAIGIILRMVRERKQRRR